MQMTRRSFLTAVAGAGSTSVLGRALRDPARLPRALLPASAATRDPAVHVMHRLTFGPRPDLLDEIRRMGPETWIERQLAYDTLDDDAELDRLLQDFPTLWQTPAEILGQGERPQRGPYLQELQLATLLRATHSQRQLYELMMHFWSDHFSMDMRQKTLPFLKPTDDREVIRPHALGRFPDLLAASAHSPAMLVYLDNATSSRRAPNENYARELMELHTLGVQGGYTEEDVVALAHLLTGWSVGQARGRQQEPVGEFLYRPNFHDDSAQVLLGQTFPAGLGQEAGERALTLLAGHPSTARFISTKLVRRFVADDPPEPVIDAAAATFTTTGGDIKAVLRTIFTDDHFWEAPPKLKRPWPYVVSLLRAFDVRLAGQRRKVRGFRVLNEYLRALGHIPFMRPTPDGYPDVAQAWADNLLGRWNVALAIVFDQIPGLRIDMERLVREAGVPLEARAIFDHFATLLLPRTLTAAEADELWAFVNAAGPPDLATEEGRMRLLEGIALLAASPAFQYR